MRAVLYTKRYSRLYKKWASGVWQNWPFGYLIGASRRLAPGLLAVGCYLGALISQKQFNRLRKRWRAGGGGMPQFGKLAVMKV